MAGDAIVRTDIVGKEGTLLVSIVLTTFMSLLRCVLCLSGSLWIGGGAVQRTEYVKRSGGGNEANRSSLRSRDLLKVSANHATGSYPLPVFDISIIIFFADYCTSNNLQPCPSFHSFDTLPLSPPLLAAQLSSPYDMPPPPHNQNPNPSLPKNLS